MTKPNLKDEVAEFNIRNEKTLQCRNYESSACGTCERCELREQLTEVKTWFPRVGNSTKKEVILGLVNRVYNSHVMNYISRLLKPAMNKDFTYVRNRSKPSLKKDESISDSNHAMTRVQVEAVMKETWKWFQNTSNWIKCIFLFYLLNTCDSHIIHLVGTEAQTLVKSPCLHDLSSTDTCAELFESERNTPEFIIGTDKPKENNMSDIADRTKISVEQTQMKSASNQYNTKADVIVPVFSLSSSSTALCSGVFTHMDFIKLLPVNLSKYILGMLDQATLNICLGVSRNWKISAEEVLKEFYINQNLNEEVMLLQGAAAHGCNPIYAKDTDVTVPNIDSDSMEILRSKFTNPDQAVEKTCFRSVYEGYSTRNIIMEERNVFCGAYNVMVVIDKYDPTRVVHTNGEKYIALGSRDRHVALIDMSTGYQVGPLMTGHAGSIKCIYLDENRNFIISGSYDTSLRMWSTVTRKPMRIFRGHTGTVQCVAVLGNSMVSGSRDQTCKVWNLNEKMALKTFNHRRSVTAVALSDELCISGCEGGKVKVWHLKKEKLIKTLTGHRDQVTTIKLDCWHIITGAKDGFVLVWSAQGNFNGCLMSLRHPNDVLSLEFQYLRIVTASADGKLRIWNMITGQCLRIMRGNSGSDAILQLIAIENRLTVNTSKNLLVLNFESVVFDYSLENDKVPPLVHFSQYSYAPVKRQSNAYIRRNRMKMSGASNEKIIHHQDINKSKSYGIVKVKNINQLKDPNILPHLVFSPKMKTKHEINCHETESRRKHVQETDLTLSVCNKSKSEGLIDEIHTPLNFMGRKKRRTSWAFETCSKSVVTHTSLNDTKALLRAQIRTPDGAILEDFNHLTEAVSDSHKKCQSIIFNRPASSPSKFETRRNLKTNELPTKTSLDGNFVKYSGPVNNVTPICESIILGKYSGTNHMSMQTVDLSVYPVSDINEDKLLFHMPKKLRPHTANIIRQSQYDSYERPKTAIDRRPQGSSVCDENSGIPSNWKQTTFITNAKSFMQNGSPPHSNSSLTTTSKEANLVPLLMFSNDK